MGKAQRRGLNVALVVLAAVLLTVYAIFDPAVSLWAPKCVFYELTGFECPGCGSQRAAHALLNGDFAAAWHYNALMVVAIPVLFLLAYATWKRERHPRLFRILNSVPAIIIAGTVITAWFIIRNFIAE